MTLAKTRTVLALAGALATTGVSHAMAATTNFSEFATVCSFTCDASVPYSDGGVTIQYMGTTSDIWSQSQPGAPSGYSWYPDGGGFGYSDITLTGGGTFSSATLLVGSGWFGGDPHLQYQLLDGGVVVSTGDFGSVPTLPGFISVTLPTGTFDELRVQAQQSSGAFDPGGYEALAIGEITLTTGVPEPGAWALMILGLGFLGATLRSARGRRFSSPAV